MKCDSSLFIYIIRVSKKRLLVLQQFHLRCFQTTTDLNHVNRNFLCTWKHYRSKLYQHKQTYQGGIMQYQGYWPFSRSHYHSESIHFAEATFVVQLLHSQNANVTLLSFLVGVTRGRRSTYLHMPLHVAIAIVVALNLTFSGYLLLTWLTNGISMADDMQKTSF